MKEWAYVECGRAGGLLLVGPGGIGWEFCADTDTCPNTCQDTKAIKRISAS